MSYDRKAPEPLKSGTDLGVTMAAGTVTPGGCYVMSDTLRDELYIGALAADRLGRFTRPMGTGEKQLRRYDGYGHGWDGRQRSAAAKLGALWKAALPGMAPPGGYAGGSKGGGTMSEDEEKVAHLAFKDYSAAIGEVELRCSSRHADALRMVVCYADPSPRERAWMVRESLTFLADWWRIR